MQSPRSQCILARPRRGGSFPPKPGGWVVATCPLAGALSHPLPLLDLSPHLEVASEPPTSQGPFPSATVPTLTFRLWWQLLSLLTWPPPACGLQGAGSREVEAPHSTLSKVFFFCPPIPRNPGPAGGGRRWNGEHPKQPLFLTAPSPVGKPDKRTGNNSRCGHVGGTFNSA